MSALAVWALVLADFASAEAAAPPPDGPPAVPASEARRGRDTFAATGGPTVSTQPTQVQHPGSLEYVSKYLNGRTLFLEKTYLTWNIPNIGPKGDRGNTPLLVEAWIAPHLAIYDGLYGLDRPLAAGAPTYEHHFAFYITPEFRLRMIKNGGQGIYSSPVRPMSFMPRVEAFEYFIWRVDWDRLRDEPAFDQPGGVFVLAPRAILFGHHSNGQEHCRYGDEAGLDGNSDPRCTAPVPGAPSTTVNFRSGDFSTDYFGGGVNAAFYSLDNSGFEHRKVAAGVVYKYNPVWSKLPGGMNDDEAALYGKHSLHVELELQNFIHGYYNPAEGTDAPPNPSGRLTPSIDSWVDGKVRVAAAVDYFWTTGAGVPSYLATVEASYALFRLGGVGLFGRFSTGRDYLNILYVEPAISTFQVGLIFDQEPLFEYHGAPRS